jgi:hypothetical protein
VAASWRQAGLDVRREPPMFVEQGKLRRLRLSGDEAALDAAGCTTVAVIAPRGVDFVIRLSTGGGERPGRPERSSAGLVTVVRCGASRGQLASLLLELRSTRAAVEVVVARGTAEAPAPTEALTERVVVPATPVRDPGRAPGQEPLAARAARAEQRARQEGAAASIVDEARASDEGGGRMLVGFREGCHRVELLADLGPGGRVADVDAEIHDGASNALLARDRSDTPDARLELCLGEGQAAVVVFGGAPPGAKVAMIDSRWPVPAGVPAAWAPRARAAAAGALMRRRVAVKGSPLAEGLGVAGGTLVPIELEPGSCYVAAVAAARGELRHLAVATTVDGRATRDDSGASRDGVAMAFCSQRAERAQLRVEARGTGVVWSLAMWRVGPAPTDGPQP